MTDTTELSQYVPGYVANLRLSPQQSDTKLFGKVDGDLSYSVPGELFNADDVDASDPEDVIGRVPDTPDKFLGATRRVGFFTEFQDSAWFDNVDAVKEITDPTSTKMMALMAGRWRKVDSKIQAAGLGGATVKTDNTDTFATTPLPASQVVLANQTGFIHQGETIPGGGVDYGMSVGKIIAANMLLDESELDGERYLLMSSKEKGQLLETTPATSQFFVAVQGLVNGQINNFMGFNIVTLASKRMLTQTSLTNGGAALSRRCMAWIRPAIMYRGRPITSAGIAVRKDKSWTPQAFYKMSHAAVRRYDSGVVDIECLAT